jgi:predicted DNA-binding transcriptional regulator AlpA
LHCSVIAAGNNAAPNFDWTFTHLVTQTEIEPSRMLKKGENMSGATNRTSYAFESDPSNRRPPTSETSNRTPNSQVPSHQPELSAHRATDTEASSPRVVSFPVPERLLNAREVAARLGVSERWVRDHTTRRAPKLRGVKLGSLMRYRNVDVEDFMEKLATSHSSLQARFGG